ncbi:PREDICTED: uncharacterized protein LOC108751826 [Trachymyrmex septentrionalis]|uniref:uncharacterized protein LOC108751826 n=1 Tax=Trachymyrmex septentrionalis TaxID=34720 RepID=UPI00084F514F|nr:PREDICTED: uncharacterized protein LOC108751826 [Trachymyrmex septentrionalis]XP_018347754.1 PREDICTED: uncharacterized protein LOC108751826 [Trachymyrmex septentrionalis]XP_018347755.1 PREDICTED: uncharacterized protein LOC108751826 [Trachymyrmex septentrionalis]
MLQILMILFICSLDLLSARPMEEPTKFTLGKIQNNTENAVHSKLEITEQINSEFRSSLNPSIKFDKPQNRRSILPIQNTTPIVLFQPTSQEIFRLENETAQAILEKPKPDNIRRLLDTFLTPKPLVDRIKDEEKYGNRGDKFIGIGRAFIDGYENFSNFLNNLVGFPVDIVKQTSRGITQTLDKLGARIIGLE